jgi:hypothetical protein
MRRAILLLAVFVLLAGRLDAQIGKRVTVHAGTPEDKALTEINATTDPAKKLELLNRFLAEFGQGEMALLAYELLISYHHEAKDIEKVYEYGEKALAADPGSFSIALMLFRVAQEQNDAARLFAYGEKIGTILAQFKASGPPEGTEAAAWEQRKADTLAEEEGNIQYVQYTLFDAAYQNPNAEEKAAQMERYAMAFPDSQYTANAEAIAAGLLRQLQNFQKMQAFAQKALERNPENPGMLLLLSDYWSETGTQLDQAEEYAKKLLEVLGKMEKPAHLTDEQWTQQKSLQEGLGHSALGQVHIHKNRNAQAVEAFRAASPLLKSDTVSYARNLYRLGFVLAKMQRIPEARATLAEAVAINSPYRPLAQDVLNRIGGAPAKAPPKKRP